MKISAFTFIKNGQILGYPFQQSIQSILPIVDEFVINVGESEDDINDSKYIIHSISANINFPNNFPDCLVLKDKVNKDLNTLFKDVEKDDWGKRVLNNVDPTLQTFGYQNIYWLSNGNIIVSCRDYGKIMEGEGHRDYFAIMIDSKYFEEWLNNEAFD